MTRIVQCLSHAIEAYDQLRLYTELGYEAVDIGGYIDPAHPHDAARPALPEVPFYPEVKAAIDALGTDDNLGAAQSNIPDAVFEWLGDDGVLIFHHYLERLVGQWARIRDWMNGAPGRRVIWRTVGQSVDGNEAMMRPLRADGLERVAYSPKEANIPGYIGHDALIRFYKDPDEWCGWHGSEAVVTNVTQNLRAREPFTNWTFWEEATRGLHRMPAGPGSEAIGGPGALTYDEMREWLRTARVYLYTGTQPASYTLGLIEAMMTGIPVVSIGPAWMRIFPFGPDLFEGHEIATPKGLKIAGGDYDANDPAWANLLLKNLLNDHLHAKWLGDGQRNKAIDLFGKAKIGAEWKAYLG